MGPLSARQQLEAVRCVQNQAEQRVQLGLKLFKAAEAHTIKYQNLVEQVRYEQQQLREKLEQDVARSLHTYDQWIGEVDEGVPEALKALGVRIDKLQNEWSGTQQRIEQIMSRSESLLDQHQLVARPEVAPRSKSTISVAPPPNANQSQDVGLTPPAEVEAPDATEESAPAKDEADRPKPIYGELLRCLLDAPES